MTRRVGRCLVRLRGRTILGPADTTPEGEDCLTLNLWTPALGDGAKGVRALIDIGVPEDYALAQTLIPTLAARATNDLPGVAD